MQVHKWSSSHPAVLEGVPESDKAQGLELDELEYSDEGPVLILLCG